MSPLVGVPLSALSVIAVSAAAIGLGGPAPAAPVPTHLMPKGPPRLHHPTAVGTKWVYDREGKDETYVITGVEEKRGAKVVAIESVNAAGKTTPSEKLLVTEGEWCWAEEVGQPYDPPWRKLKFPSGEGYEWEFNTSRSGLGVQIKGTATQAAGTERVKVPAGTFTAVRVEMKYTLGDRAQPVVSPRWYASGVGLVRIGDPPTLVLKEFTPGKD